MEKYLLDAQWYVKQEETEGRITYRRECAPMMDCHYDLLKELGIIEHNSEVLKGQLAKILPGGYVYPHTDPGSEFRIRWHVPIQPAGYTWMEGKAWRATEPFVIKHWLTHAMWNKEDVARIHLIVDLLEINHVPESRARFTLIHEDLEKLPELKEMVGNHAAKLPYKLPHEK